MKHRGRKMIYCTVVVLLLKLYMTEGSPTRPGQQNENDMLSFSVNSSQTCDDYSWKINDRVVAHDQNFSKALVQERGRSHIVFKSCQTNVSYFCDKDMIITWEDVCKPSDPSNTEMIHEKNNTIGAGVLTVIVIGVVAVIVIIGVIVLIVARLKLKVCQPGDNSFV